MKKQKKPLANLIFEVRFFRAEKDSPYSFQTAANIRMLDELRSQVANKTISGLENIVPTIIKMLRKNGLVIEQGIRARKPRGRPKKSF